MRSKKKDEEDTSLKDPLVAVNNKLKVIINVLNLQQKIMVDVFEEFSAELKKKT